MGFKLPKLTGWVSSPVYAGLEMECWLNPTAEEYQRPEKPEAWESEYLWHLGRIFLRLRIPAALSDDGEEQVIELGNAKALWELQNAGGWDRSELERIFGAWAQQRHGLLENVSKN